MLQEHSCRTTNSASLQWQPRKSQNQTFIGKIIFVDAYPLYKPRQKSMENVQPIHRFLKETGSAITDFVKWNGNLYSQSNHYLRLCLLIKGTINTLLHHTICMWSFIFSNNLVGKNWQFEEFWLSERILKLQFAMPIRIYTGTFHLAVGYDVVSPFTKGFVELVS